MRQIAAIRERMSATAQPLGTEIIDRERALDQAFAQSRITLDALKAETAVIAFDLEGIAVSSGAACSSGRVQPSHVLAAMGVSPGLLRGAVRVSLGFETTETEVEALLNAWRKLATALSKGQSGIAA